MATILDYPIYLIAETDPAITEWHHAFNMFADPENVSFCLDISEDVIEKKQVGTVQMCIAALQHHPHLIEKMIFSMHFNFTEIEGSSLYLPESYWKDDPRFFKWFSELFKMPLIIFFINDADARSFALIGDLLTDGSLTYLERDKYQRSQVVFSETDFDIYVNRVFKSCWMMLVYCHNTGFNPETYIQSLLADLYMSFLWEHVFEKYTADIEKGIQLVAVEA